MVWSARRKKAKELSREMGIGETSLLLLRSGNVKGVRYSALAALCGALECTPGGLLGYRFDLAGLEREEGETSDRQ